MLERRVLQVFEPRGRLAELDRQRRELQFLLEGRDRNRGDGCVNLMRFRQSLIPFPSPDRTAAEQQRAQNNDCRQDRMGAPIDMDSREAALQPQGRPIEKLAKRGSENSSEPSREPREWANQPPPEINHKKCVLFGADSVTVSRMALARGTPKAIGRVPPREERNAFPRGRCNLS